MAYELLIIHNRIMSNEKICNKRIIYASTPNVKFLVNNIELWYSYLSLISNCL